MNNIFKKVYKKVPISIQNMIVSLYGYKIYRQRYRKVYYDSFKEFMSKDYSNLKKEEENQNNLLRFFLKFAVENSPFYRELYSNIDINKIETVKDLSILPIIDKETIRKNIDKLYTINEKDAIVGFTGGTTGKSLKVLYTKDDFQRRMAYLDAFKSRLGINTFKVKKATFSGREIITNPKKKVFWRYNYIYKQRLYSTFNMTEENLPYYIDDLNKFKPEVINGFVSAIFELAKFIKNNQIRLSFQAQAIFTTSETLLPIHRELIEDVFNTKIYNQYASAEGAPFITECKCGELHYNLDTGVIETLPTNIGNQMIITSFTTHGTPLIRYNIGDIISFKDGTCKCGSSHPLVEYISGRKVDFLFSKEKGLVSLSHLADVIKGMPNNIRKMQFIQNSIDSIEILIMVDDNSFDESHIKSIMEEMKYRFGYNMNIEIKITEDIPNESSGKFTLIKNKIIDQYENCIIR